MNDTFLFDQKGGQDDIGQLGKVKKWRRRPRGEGVSYDTQVQAICMGKRHVDVTAIANLDGGNERGAQKQRMDSMEVDVEPGSCENYVSGPTTWTLSEQ